MGNCYYTQEEEKQAELLFYYEKIRSFLLDIYDTGNETNEISKRIDLAQIYCRYTKKYNTRITKMVDDFIVFYYTAGQDPNKNDKYLLPQKYYPETTEEENDLIELYNIFFYSTKNIQLLK
jgi:hypothetical protein